MSLSLKGDSIAEMIDIFWRRVCRLERGVGMMCDVADLFLFDIYSGVEKF